MKLVTGLINSDSTLSRHPNLICEQTRLEHLNKKESELISPDMKILTNIIYKYFLHRNNFGKKNI